MGNDIFTALEPVITDRKTGLQAGNEGFSWYFRHI